MFRMKIKIKIRRSSDSSSSNILNHNMITSSSGDARMALRPQNELRMGQGIIGNVCIRSRVCGGP